MSFKFETLPTDIINTVFSYLTIKDLNNVSRTSKNLNMLEKNCKFWKDLCLKHMDLQVPHVKSWKESYRIISSWNSGDCCTAKKIFSKDMKAYPSGHDFTIANDTLYEVFLPEDKPSTKGVQLLRTNHKKLFAKISGLNVFLNEFRKDRKYSSEDRIGPQLNLHQLIKKIVYLNQLIILDNKTNIYCYDIPSRHLLFHIPGNPKTLIEQAEMTYDGKELVTYYDNRIRIWDVVNKVLKSEHKFETSQTVWKISTIANLVIIQEGKEHNKSQLRFFDRQNNQEIEQTIPSSRFDVNNTTLAVLQERDNQYLVKIYDSLSRDGQPKLSEKNTFYCLNTSDWRLHGYANWQGSIKIVNNWLLVCHRKFFETYNMNNGKLITSFDFNYYNIKKVSFSYTPTQVFFQILKKRAKHKYEYEIVLCDFDKKVKKWDALIELHLDFESEPELDHSVCNLQ